LATAEQRYIKLAGKLQGEVVSVRDSGNIVTSITSEQLSEVPTDESVIIRCDGHTTAGIFPADHDQPEMTFLAVLGSDDQLELILVGDSAHKFLGIRVGANVTVKW
jgi:S-adenosylmethionine hydrolase